ncbi:MGA_1079 family surface serine endopeptidase [Mycoplasmopsis alligatoris]|uniref:Lipoprotein n=1 Tax=Mycoplasmopsis alligatoris A21JP2 TaxID=747682 RepID=D4XW71_9BACT|nr:hypothetical protein [Mycoplasmopsis alligatoris]EFF41429.1 hypothetical protein MALL_0706 [Mycoplasmopsis alligatoris A21JP2]
MKKQLIIKKKWLTILSTLSALTVLTTLSCSSKAKQNEEATNNISKDSNSDSYSNIKNNINNEKLNQISLNLRQDAQIAIKNFNIKLFSGSITKDNFSNYFTFNNTDQYDYEIENIKTDPNNNNKLNFDVFVFNKQKSEKGKITRSFSFENDIQEIINEESKKEEFEHYIEIKDTTKNLYAATEFFKNKNYTNLIRPLHRRYFTFRIKNVTKTTMDKANVVLEMLLNDKIVKEFSVTSSNWKGQEFLNLSNDKKSKYLLDKHIARYNELLSLKDFKKKAPINYSPKDVVLSDIFNIEQIDGYKIEIEKVSNSENLEAAKLKYKFKITNLKTNTVTYSNPHELGGFARPNDPTNYDDFNDEYFKTTSDEQKNQDNTKLQEDVKKINGYNFNLRKTGDFSYLDPSFMNSKNLRYFLGFTGPERVEIEVEDENGATGKKKIKPYNYDKDIQIEGANESGVSLLKLQNDYFFAFYDVKASTSKDNYKTQGGNDELTFKLGLINKKNPKIKAHTNTIKLVNLKNEVADKYFRIVDLNKITLDNLEIKNSELSNISVSELISKNNSQDLIKVKYDKNLFKYKKYNLKESKYIEDFKIVASKEINGNTYIQLGFDKNWSTKKDEDKQEKSSTWIKINGLKNNDKNDLKINSNYEILKSLGINSNLLKLQNSQNEFSRYRKLEFSWKNGIWKTNTDKSKIEYLLPNDHFKEIFENTSSNVSERLIHLDLPIFFNNGFKSFELQFLNKSDKWAYATINYDKLRTSKTITISNLKANGQGNKKDNTTEFSLKATLRDDGIFIEIIPSYPGLKFTQNLFKDVLNGYPKDFNSNEDEIDETRVNKDIAIFYDSHATKIALSYKNNIKNENFIDYQTNIFDYDKVTFTQENQPFVTRNKYTNENIYKFNFNQNVPYKWSEGYKTNLEVLHDDYDFKEFNDIKARVFRSEGTTGGTFTMFKKLNNDKNDYKFYVITNEHVVEDPFDMLNRPTKYLKRSHLLMHNNHLTNDLYNGEKFYEGQYNLETLGLTSFWYNKQNDPKRNNHYIDVHISIVDIKNMINEAKNSSRHEMAAWLENWMNLKDLDFSYETLYESKSKSHLTYESLYSGFPQGKLYSYMHTRPWVNESIMQFSKDDFLPVFNRPGNSGTSVFNNNGQLWSIINSANFDVTGVAYLMSNPNVDHYGSNANGNPLLKTYKYSVIAQLYRANAYDPYQFKLFEESKVK